jgi:hypothetical protein
MKRMILVAALVIGSMAVAQGPSQAAPAARAVTSFATAMPAHFRPTYVFRCRPSMVPRGCKDAFR